MSQRNNQTGSTFLLPMKRIPLLRLVDKQIYDANVPLDDTELGQLMHDLHCKDALDMNSKVLAKRVRELKETQEGVEFMCREMEQIYSEE